MANYLTKRRAAKKDPIWHDPKKGDLPDAGISVVALCEHQDDDGRVLKRMFLGESCGWKNAETDRVSRYSVVGWMTDEEVLGHIGERLS